MKESCAQVLNSASTITVKKLSGAMFERSYKRKTVNLYVRG